MLLFSAWTYVVTRRKNKYQILYFPLTEPLNEEQRWARRDLTCIRVP